MGLSQLGGSSYSRLVTKQNAAGQTLLPVAAPGTNGVGFTATAGSFSAWQQVVAFTTAEYYVVGVALTTANSLYDLTLEIGIGGAGSETILADIAITGQGATSGSGSPLVGGSYPLMTPLRVASGSRLAVRVYPNAGGANPQLKVWLTVVPYANVEGN